MIKLFSLKQQKKDGEASPKSGNQKKASAAQLRITKDIKFTKVAESYLGRNIHGLGEVDPFSIRCTSTIMMQWTAIAMKEVLAGLDLTIQDGQTTLKYGGNEDINELNLPKTCNTEFPDPDDLLNFKLVICPDEGFYRSGRFVFSFKVGPNYPHEPPKVKCETPVYHPNIDLDGNVCLNILREDWKPVLTINSIVYGLQYLFLEPNPEDPLNKEAAEVLQNNRRLFEQNVQKAMRGGYVGSVYFDRCLK